MNHNVGMQHPGLLVWTGSAAIPRDITKFNYFGFVFEVIAAITTDAVFEFRAHERDPSNPCNPLSGTPVKEIPLCDPNITADDNAQITFPAGTPVGTICAATIPCRPGPFVSVASVSGTTNALRAVLVLSGPQF